MGHTYANLLYHVVFSTKDRRPAIDADLRGRLREYMAGVARQEFGRAISIGGTENHIHGLISVRPAISVADAMKKWKSLSSGWVNRSVNMQDGFYWQRGYAAFSVSQSAAARVTAYIESQAEHHRRTSFEEELVAFPHRHGMSYDPETIWD